MNTAELIIIVLGFDHVDFNQHYKPLVEKYSGFRKSKYAAYKQEMSFDEAAHRAKCETVLEIQIDFAGLEAGAEIQLS